MKQNAFKTLALVLLAILGSVNILTAQAHDKKEDPAFYAVINKAAWCPACQANDSKVMNEVIPGCMSLNVQFITNDLTDEKSIATSTAELKNKKLFTAVREHKATGLILLIDPKTKKVVKQISITKPAEQIIKEITDARS